MLYRPKTPAAEAAMLGLVSSGIAEQVEESTTNLQPVTPASVLVEVRTLADAERIDPVVPAGTPGTVQCPTGHVLSLARPDLGEGFWSYLRRVSAQAGGDPDTAAGAQTYGDMLFEVFGGFRADGSNWHLAADRFYNLRAYMTPAELAQDDRARSQWSAIQSNLAAAAWQVKPGPAINHGSGEAATAEQSIVDYYRNLPSQDARDAVLLMIGSAGHNELMRSGAATPDDLQMATARRGGSAGVDLATGRPWVSDGMTRAYVGPPLPARYLQRTGR